jgi:hypothetical protein
MLSAYVLGKIEFLSIVEDAIKLSSMLLSS